MNKLCYIAKKFIVHVTTRQINNKKSKSRRRTWPSSLILELLEARHAPDGTPLVGALDVSNNHVADNNFSPNDLGKTQRDQLAQTLKNTAIHPGYWNFFVGGVKAGLQRCA